LNSKAANNPLVVEFIGVTGVGKSTLIAAVAQFLSAQGLRVRDAEEVILARFGLALPRHPKTRSALTLLLGLPMFGRYCLTREGRKLSRLALGSIGRGMGSVWTGASLLRNFMKRIGSHLLLETLRDDMRDCDLVIWDEGIVHAAHNLFVHAGTEPRRDEIEEFGRMVPKPDLIIWVTAPTSQSAEVVLGRGHSRVRATTSAARAFAEHAQTTFDVLSAIPGLRERIYRVDNSAHSTDQNGAAIRARASLIGDFLVQQLHRHQPPFWEGEAPADLRPLDRQDWNPVPRKLATSNGRLP
jgi:thymidylate kinase